MHLDWPSIITSLLGSGAIIGAVIPYLFTKRDRLAHAYNELAEAQAVQQSQINTQREEINRLEQDNHELKNKLDKYEEQGIVSVRYLRSLYHWGAQLCDVLDSDWLQEHPKPSLPDSLRETIRGKVK